MIQPVSLFVGLRYSRSTKGNAFISFISFFSIAGIALGLAALIVVNSVMNGFEKNLKSSMLALIPHVQIAGKRTEIEKLLPELKNVENVKEIGEHLAVEAVLQTNSQLQGVRLQGGSKDDTSLIPFLKQGSWEDLQDSRYTIAVSRYLASALNVNIGDEIRVIIPSVSNYTPMGRVPVQRVLTVSTIFSTESEADLHLAYTSFDTLERLLKRKSADDATYSIKLFDAFGIQPILELLAKHPTLAVSDWRVEQGALFSAVAMEKRIMTLLLTLIVLVAAFNILSAISMMVNEKQSEIAILQTLGFTPLKIMQIFMVQGSYNGVVGTFIGGCLGIILTLNINEALSVVGLNLLGGMKLPTVIEPFALTLMILSSLLLSFIATVLPAFKAAKVLPAEVLRYE